MTGAGPLAGRSIVVTRPEKQAAELVALIENRGGRAIRFPTLQIVAEDSAALSRLVQALDGFDLAIFISRNAAEHGLAQVGRVGRWPSALEVAAIGEATRRSLEEAGIRNVLSPDGQADSEALLAHPGLQAISGKRVVIFRGVGGRETLATGLRARGALVDYAECYRRVRPAADPLPLIEARARGELHALTVSSREGLANFDALLGEAAHDLLQRTPVFVPHARVAEAARALGIDKVVIAGPTDDEMVASLVAYFGHSG